MIELKISGQNWNDIRLHMSMATICGVKPVKTGVLPAAIGAKLQGGIYVGPLVESNALVHVIASSQTLDACEWNEARDAAMKCAAGGHSDWRLPTKNELMLAAVNVPDKFEKEGHWSRTHGAGDYFWIVAFEDGEVFKRHRDHNLAVRPFRRYIPEQS